MNIETKATRAIFDLMPVYKATRTRPMTDENSLVIENMMDLIDYCYDKGDYPLVIFTCELLTDYMEAMR